jgi:5-methyltetrahydrofolate--homocysteine methyltransferase
MARRFLESLKEGILIGDGAMGTMLLNAGLQTGECPEEWNISRPDVVKGIHEQYFSAGCNISASNTFGGSRFKLQDFGFEGRVKEFNQNGVRLAKEAAPEGCFVSLSVGPTGKFIEPLGEIPYVRMVDVFSEQIEAGVEGGADIICIETMYDMNEARAAIEAAKKTCGLPVITTMTFNRTAAGFRTMMGVEPKQVFELLESGADVVGSNCGTGIDEMIELMREMRRIDSKAFLIAQPNAGMPVMEGGKMFYKEAPEEMAKKALEFVRLGVNIIGGCCGTTPVHLKKIVENIRKHEKGQG